MKEAHLVSILMPVYNVQKYLADCLDSILAQEYGNWQLVAVNDFSTDTSAAILEEYAAKDQRIKVYNNTKKGIIPALQLAYEKATGKIITRMDSDDKMLPHKLQLFVQQLEEHGHDHLAVGAVEYFSSASTLGNGYQRYAAWLNQLIAKGACFDDLYKECVIPSPAWAIWRTDFEACGAFRSETYPEDYDLCFRFYAQQLKVIPNTTIVHLWRDYPSRTSRTSDNYADNRFLDIKIQYFLALNYNKNKKLVLWGAGKKGKQIAQKLLKQNIAFDWVCDNPKKIGKDIYQQKILSTTHLRALQNAPQIIIAVAQITAQKEISHFLEAKNWKTMQDYFFFC